MTEKEKMLAGEPYDAKDPELSGERLRIRPLLRELCRPETAPGTETYRSLIRQLLPRCPEDIWIEPPFFCDYGYNIYCGENVFFNFDCVILDAMPVRIGNNCLFAPKVQLYTATHPSDAATRRKTEYAAPITIGNDCWIGGGAIVCPGVTIGDRVVVGAGSVVTRDIPSDSIVAGNPARPIR